MLTRVGFELTRLGYRSAALPVELSSPQGLEAGGGSRGGVKGVRPSFWAYVPVYILWTQAVFCNDNGNGYLTSVTKTRCLQSQLGMLPGR